MPAPTWDQYMIPSLHVLVDGQMRRTREIVDRAADLLQLSETDRAVLIPSGQEQWKNRGNWALSYLARAGAVERPSRGRYVITEVGRELLGAHPGGMTEKDLRSVPGYDSPRLAQKAAADAAPATPAPVVEERTELDPDEQIENGIARIHADVADQLLTRIQAQDPEFFEKAVLDLLMAMGYGGAEGSATRTQLSRDGGIDGIIDQDALGLSRIYVQAKRYASDNTVGRPAIQEFVGALAGNAASQGVFLTTSRFSVDAQRYADQVQARIVLVDGAKLSRLMIRYGVGVQVRRTVQIVDVDEDFFE
ncbi:restriction endonuclease [Brachybacterium faecium DSM 4810]|uniref:Restriction endonuclease n=1 Tax=Brachybacterium faecium (strain ATCC 43885 / DSM 4810 / JCM 11609 / LMG 19847 / NBRC 14762 / NCIMB 9860 / 6-10) TaxID=446465 RepID=C7MHI9_BRAFD|nr:restriction endonuclease [Brachybacterium faecium]ACU84398.1 restriction endonuclease [Brachybacterium faecium DSM 4810]